MQPVITGAVTWLHFIGSCATDEYPWYDIQSHDNAEEDAWRIVFRDGADPEEPDREYVLDHTLVMAAVRSLAAGYCLDIPQGERRGASLEAMRQCALFLADPDCADFDAGTADEVLQFAAFGRVVYS